MEQLILQSRFTQQPQQPAQIDRSNPQFAQPHVLILASVDVNLATGMPLRRGGAGYVKAPLPGGITNAFRKNFFLASEVLPAIGTQSYVEFWYGYPSADQGTKGGGTNEATLLTGSSANNSFICSRLNGYVGGSPNSWGALYRWSDVFYAAEDIAPPGVLTLFLVHRKQDRMEFWRDGILRRTIMVGPWSLAASSFTVGTFVEDPYWTSSSDMLAAGRFLGEWNASQIRGFSENPYRALKAPTRRLWIASAAAGPTYTLPMSAGTFASSGSGARLVAARRLAAAAAGFALTPTAASLLAARRIVAAPGALSLVGTAANIKAARRLPAAAVAVALTGGAAKLTAARKLTAAPAAFTLTGGTATFVYTPKPGGQGPTYTLTGGSGAFLLTASAARLLLARRMVAAAGAFSATGMPAALAAARRLRALPGSFAFVGGAAGLRAVRRLAAGFATFSASGVAAKLAVARRLPAATGSFAVAGADALMKYSANRGEIDIDASTIPANRTVVFGAFSRVVVFGANSRVVVFGGATRVVVFDDPKIEKENSMANAEEPYFVDGKWFCDKDPDEKSYFVADISKELAKRHTTAVSVEVIVGGVTCTEGPDIQGSLIVVKLEGMDVTDGADNFWTARVTCANTEQFDRTTWLNKVDN